MNLRLNMSSLLFRRDHNADNWQDTMDLLFPSTTNRSFRDDAVLNPYSGTRLSRRSAHNKERLNDLRYDYDILRRVLWHVNLNLLHLLEPFLILMPLLTYRTTTWIFSKFNHNNNAKKRIRTFKGRTKNILHKALHNEEEISFQFFLADYSILSYKS